MHSCLISRFYTGGALSIDSPTPTSTPDLKKTALYTYTLNVMFQIPGTFKIYLVFKNT
jgi:hypothetical protein